MAIEEGNAGAAGAEHKLETMHLQRELDAMTALHELGTRLSHASFADSALVEIVDAAIAISGADFGNIQLIDPRTSDLRIVAQRGFPSWWVEFWNTTAAGQGTCGTALERGERVIVEDVEHSPIFAGTPALLVQRTAGVRAVQSTPISTRAGQPVGMFSTHYRTVRRLDDRELRLLDLLARQAGDLIERGRIHDRLRESEQRYAAIFQISPFAIALTRRSDGAIVDVNEAFLALFEYTRDEVLGRRSVDLEIADEASYARVAAELATRGSVHALECVRRTRSGDRRVLSLHICPVDIDGQPHVLTEVIDVTERERSEARQRQLGDQLAALNRDLERRIAERTEELRRATEIAESASAAKSEFLSSMSHELRTPLNAILGFAQLLERDRKHPLDERQLERLQHVIRGGEHMVELVDDILDLARIETGRVMITLEPVAVADVLAKALTTLEPMAARARIEIAAPPEIPAPPRVTADRVRLAQILMNFVSNAIKYGRADGHVAFRVERLGSAMRIAVVDDGLGIPADKQDRIFEPFERAGQEAGPVQGTGIGLTISKRLAEAMHATIGFTSEIGRGSEFWIDLPIDPTSAHAQAGAPAASQPAPPTALASEPSRYTVVYIEDNPENIAFMRDLACEWPSVELLTAHSAEIGLELVRQRVPDVVVLDINLPGMSGLAAIEHLRAWPETRAIPVVALSAAALADDKARAASAGFTSYLTKPVKVGELAAILGDLLAGDPREHSRS